ncbi:unnamed protein product, partial [Prunus brigantina]
MKSFLWSLDERVWSTVVHGFPKPTKKIEKGDEETTVLKTREEWTTAEVKKIPEDRVVKKILRSLPQRFQPKITAIEEIRDLNTLKVQELIGFIQTYEMKHLAPKKSKNVAFKVVNEEDDGHSNEDCSDEELTILTRRFMNFLKNQDPRSRDSKGYGHISSECANTLKKQKDGKNKAMRTTWSDSESECDNDEKAVALITTVSLDESHEDHDCKDINIEFIMNKYDDLLAASQKHSKQNSELVKEVAVLKLENCRIANEFQSPDTDSKKMISMGRRDGDKGGLGFEPSNKSSAVSKTKFVKSSSSIEPSAAHEVKKFIPICHFCGTRGHIRPICNKLRNEFAS